MIDTGTPPTLAQAKMLLTWIGEYYPGLVLPNEQPNAVENRPPEELVDSGELPGHQMEIPDGIEPTCDLCDKPFNSLTGACDNPDCTVTEEEE